MRPSFTIQKAHTVLYIAIGRIFEMVFTFFFFFKTMLNEEKEKRASTLKKYINLCISGHCTINKQSLYTSLCRAQVKSMKISFYELKKKSNIYL